MQKKLKIKYQYLHIISFDIPFPANYGGVIDVFYKIKSLHKLGVKIILHAYQYGDRTAQKELEKYTEKVFYYKRNMGIGSHLDWKPFIVSSRMSRDLFERLENDNYPILFEGVHTTGFINNDKFKERLTIVRMHNIEWQYYKNLAILEKKWWKRLFFHLESRKLKSTESIVAAAADVVLAISKGDLIYLEKKYKKCVYLPPFHPNNNIKIKTGKLGRYALFHGKLSVSDNEAAAFFLINKVFAGLDFPLIIAGKSASKILLQAATKYSHITIKSDVSHLEMKELIENAQIHILWSFQVAGMKLKLLEALFSGRHCILNQETIANTGLDDLCHIVNNEEEAQKKVMELKNVIFSEKEADNRKRALLPEFSNERYAQEIKTFLKIN